MLLIHPKSYHIVTFDHKCSFWVFAVEENMHGDFRQKYNMHYPYHVRWWHHSTVPAHFLWLYLAFCPINQTIMGMCVLRPWMTTDLYVCVLAGGQTQEVWHYYQKNIYISELKKKSHWFSSLYFVPVSVTPCVFTFSSEPFPYLIQSQWLNDCHNLIAVLWAMVRLICYYTAALFNSQFGLVRRWLIF